MKAQHDRCHYSAGNENKTNIASVTDYLHLKIPHQFFVDFADCRKSSCSDFTGKAARISRNAQSQLPGQILP